MKTRLSYLPSADVEKVFWLNNFSSKIGTHATALGLSTAEVTSVQKDAAFFSYIENMVESYKLLLNNIVSYKELVKKSNGTQHLGALPTAPALGTAPVLVAEGIFDRISKLVTRIKLHTGYSDSIGHDLGIIAPESTIDISALQPILKVVLEDGKPKISTKRRRMDAFDLFVDRHDGLGFITLGRFCDMDYHDTALLPAGTSIAVWTYKAKYVKGNGTVGLMSGEVNITVM